MAITCSSVDPARRNFLRARFHSGERPPRPPWARSEADFTACCSRCDDCIRVCPEGILQRGSGGFPEIQFARSGCTFCGDCARVCKPGAIAAGPLTPEAAWSLKGRIEPNCLALKAVMCRSCGDPCDERAIRFRPTLGGVERPQLDPERCTGCGFCVGVCPVTAIKILPEEVAHEGT